MKLLCHLQRLPRVVRLMAAWALVAAGGPLFLTPFPGGIVLVSIGCLILYCACPSLRKRIAGLLLRGPKMKARFAPLLSACDGCAENGHAPSKNCRPSRLKAAGELPK